MRASNGFGPGMQNDDQAVSPVMGVILMVAITAVLAGVVFVLVNGMNRGTDPPAPLGVQVLETSDRLEITSSGYGADWSQLTVAARSCVAPTAVIFVAASATPHHNQQSTALSRTAISTAGCASPVPVQVATAPTMIRAGDFLSFCSSGPVSNVEIQLVQSDSNTQIATYTLATVAPCA